MKAILLKDFKKDVFFRLINDSSAPLEDYE